MPHTRLLSCIFIVCLLVGCRSESASQNEIDTALTEESPKVRIGKLINIALDQNNSGEVDQAKATLKTAATEAASIVKPSAQASAWNEIAYTYAKLSDTVAAEESVGNAIAATANIDTPERQAAETAKSALTFEQLQNETKTNELLDQAEQLARSAETPFGKATALLAVAFWSVPAKDNDRAQRLIEEAGELTSQLDSLPGKALATEAIRIKVDRINQYHKSKGDFGETIVAAQLVDPAAHDVYALIGISERLIDIGFAEDAHWLLDKAEASAKNIEDEGTKIEALQDIDKLRQKT